MAFSELRVEIGYSRVYREIAAIKYTLSQPYPRTLPVAGYVLSLFLFFFQGFSFLGRINDNTTLKKSRSDIDTRHHVVFVLCAYLTDYSKCLNYISQCISGYTVPSLRGLLVWSALFLRKIVFYDRYWLVVLQNDFFCRNLVI
jgi:hypothetical protein